MTARVTIRNAGLLCLLAACGGDPVGPVVGSLALNVSGLPAGTPAQIHITGPGGFAKDVAATATLSGLTPGGYLVAAAVVTTGDHAYTPSPVSQNVTVSDSPTPAGAVVSYAPASGSLTLTVTGLPVGTDPAITVTGPDGYSRSVTSSLTLSALAPGDYTVTALPVSDGATQYTPSPSSRTITIGANTAGSAQVAYSSGSAGGFNLRVDGLYLVQSVQTYGRSVPLVKGRDALLRVFVTANGVNVAAPAVRVRLYHAGTLVSTSSIAAPGFSTPQTANEGDLAASWNLVISKADVQPDLAVLVDVDPDNTVVEGNEADNVFPANGVPLPVDVRTTDAFAVRLVPVVTSADGRTGNVTTGNMGQFLAATMRMHPLAAYDAIVGQPYTTSEHTKLQSDGTSWAAILSEIEAARVDAGDGRAWYGVVNPDYSSGVAGMGYIGAPSAIGWDKLPSASGVAAHEWGHNWGRQHAPCGNPANPDPSFPYGGGVTGVYGYDEVDQVVKPPTSHDLMGYCSNDWISDYTYLGVLDYRAQHPMSASSAGQAVQPALLVWGRIDRDRVILEPAFRVFTRPSLPRVSGPYRIEGRSVDGSSVIHLDFDPPQVADAPDAPRSFAFAVPLSSERADRLATLTLTGAGRSATVSAAPQSSPVDVRGAPGGRVRLRWDAAAAPVVLVRDPATGQVIAFARGGQADVVTRRGELSLSVGDRVGGRDVRIVVPR
ncbi:MAG: CARDB domain-containing protein [Gemmatimonadales bacterium]